MTIDERIEALTRNLELSILANRDNFKLVGESLVTLSNALARLAHIAEFHDHRLDSHNDRLDEIEGKA